MKIKTLKFAFMLAVLVVGCKSTNKISTPESWSKKQASDWFNKKDWIGQSKLQPDPAFDKKTFAIAYHKNKAWWDKAFNFLKNEDLSSLSVGTHEIDGKNVFVKVTEYNSKAPDNVLFEAHKDYADIHYVVSGKEYLEWASPTKAILKTPYDSAKDIVFFEAKGNHMAVVEPGTFYFVFPDELHRSGIKVGESVWVKKIVIKIKRL